MVSVVVEMEAVLGDFTMLRNYDLCYHLNYYYISYELAVKL